jgi:hypothetical protein
MITAVSFPLQLPVCRVIPPPSGTGVDLKQQGGQKDDETRGENS